MKWLDKLNKREKALSLFIAALVIISALYTTLIRPVYRSLARLNKDIDMTSIELKKAIKILEQRENVDNEYNKYIGIFSAGESDEEEMALILNEIEVLARNSAVKIINMKPRRTQKSGFYHTFYVDVDTEASMRNNIKFIKALKDSKLSLCVEQLTLNSRVIDPTTLSGSLTISRLGIVSTEKQ